MAVSANAAVMHTAPQTDVVSSFTGGCDSDAVTLTVTVKGVVTSESKISVELLPVTQNGKNIFFTMFILTSYSKVTAVLVLGRAGLKLAVVCNSIPIIFDEVVASETKTSVGTDM